MTIYVSKAQVNEAIRDIKAGKYPNSRIVKGGYNNYDKQGYLVSEVRISDNWKPHEYCEKYCELYMKKQKGVDGVIRTKCFGSNSWYFCSKTGNNLEDMLKNEKKIQKEEGKIICFRYDKKTKKMVRVSTEDFNKFENKLRKTKDQDYWETMKNKIFKVKKEKYRNCDILVDFEDNVQEVFIWGSNGFNKEIAEEKMFFLKNGTDVGSKKIQRQHSWLKKI